MAGTSFQREFGAILSSSVPTATQATQAVNLAQLEEHGVSVVRRGADPTGVADSLAAFNAALASGVPTYIPAGLYHFSARPSYSGSGKVKIVGAGCNLVTLDKRIDITNATGVEISGIAQKTSGESICLLTSCADVIVESCLADGCNNGVVVQGCSDVIVRNNIIRNVQFSGIRLAKLGNLTTDACVRAVISGNSIYNAVAVGRSGGSGHAGIQLSGGGFSSYHEKITIANNLIDGTQYVGIAGDGPIRGYQVVGNIVRGIAALANEGITFGPGEDFVIVGNIVNGDPAFATQTFTTGILLYGLVVNGYVADNAVLNLFGATNGIFCHFDRTDANGLTSVTIGKNRIVNVQQGVLATQDGGGAATGVVTKSGVDMQDFGGTISTEYNLNSLVPVRGDWNWPLRVSNRRLYSDGTYLKNKGTSDPTSAGDTGGSYLNIVSIGTNAARAGSYQHGGTYINQSRKDLEWYDTGTSVWNRTRQKQIIALTDAATVAVDLANGDYLALTAGSGVGASRTISTPTNCDKGDEFVLEIKNSTGGAMTTTMTGYTFTNGVYVDPANTKTRKYCFLCRTAGSAWVEQWRTADY